MLALADKLFLLLPLLAAMLYALAAMGVKAASTRGIDLPRINILATWVTALAFLVFIRPSQGLIAHPWWPPVLAGLLFFLGQICTFLALSRGDVSLATPLLGTKVVMVALLLSTVFHAPVSWATWLGAVVALAGIAFLQCSSRGGHWAHVTLTLVASLLAAGSFAAYDAMVQVWSKQNGVGYARLVPPSLLIGAVLSLTLAPLSTTPWRNAARSAYGFLALGAILMAAQSLVLITTVGIFGDAAGCNIVYGSRGIWSIVLVYWLGRHFGNTELHVGRSVVIARIVGSLLLMAAIVLAFA
jgi:drug/metabolite transporter (DMT)-like permease